MLTGGLTLLAGLAWPAAGRLVGLPAWLFLSYTIGVIERLARLPAASVPLRLSAGGLLGVYALIAVVTIAAAIGQPQRRAARRPCPAAAAATTARRRAVGPGWPTG